MIAMNQRANNSQALDLFCDVANPKQHLITWVPASLPHEHVISQPLNTLPTL